LLFHVLWDFTDSSEEGERRSLKLFQNWKPPEGADIKAFYGFADGSGGAMIVEVDSAATLARMSAPWTPWLSFTTTPILPVEDAAGIAGEGVAFRDSVD
jgi:hypothetical protein